MPFGGADGDGERDERALPAGCNPNEGARGRAGVELLETFADE